MIDSRTLRKGNWVLHIGVRRIIEEIGKHGIDLYGDFDGEVYADIQFEDLEPIDIKPELLEEVGFEEYKNVDEVSDNELQLTASNYRKVVVHEGERFVFESIYGTGWTFQGIKLPLQPLSFHELQNQFYYLMGVELNLPKYE